MDSTQLIVEFSNRVRVPLQGGYKPLINYADRYGFARQYNFLVCHGVKGGDIDETILFENHDRSQSYFLFFRPRKEQIRFGRSNCTRGGFYPMPEACHPEVSSELKRQRGQSTEEFLANVEKSFSKILSEAHLDPIPTPLIPLEF